GLLELFDGLVEPAAIGKLDPPGVVLIRKGDVVLLAGHAKRAMYAPGFCTSKAELNMRKLPWLGLVLALGCAVPKRSWAPPARPTPVLQPGSVPTRDAGLPSVPASDSGMGQITLVAAGDVTLGFHFEEYLDDQIADGGTREAFLGYPFAGVAQETA